MGLFSFLTKTNPVAKIFGDVPSDPLSLVGKITSSPVEQLTSAISSGIGKLTSEVSGGNSISKVMPQAAISGISKVTTVSQGKGAIVSAPAQPDFVENFIKKHSSTPTTTPPVPVPTPAPNPPAPVFEQPVSTPANTFLIPPLETTTTDNTPLSATNLIQATTDSTPAVDNTPILISIAAVALVIMLI
jgi:hypothetical protein